MSRRLATPMLLPRTICAAPAPFPILSPPTTHCSKSSCSCFSAARSTRSGSPTRRSTGSKPPNSLIDNQEDSMEAAIDRIMMTYDLLVNRTAAASAEARAKVTDYLAKLMEAGEKDTHRLTVCGLTYLRELDGSSDPVKAGFTGM